MNVVCVGADTNCFISYKQTGFSNIIPSSVVVPFTYDNFDLALKSLSNITKWGSKLGILIKFF